MSSAKSIPFGLALGAAATLCQVLAVREFLPVAAGSEISIGLFLCAWLLCVGAGAQLARRTGARATGLCAVAGLSIVLFPVAVEILRRHHVLLPIATGDLPGPGLALLLGLIGAAPAALANGYLFAAGSTLSGQDERDMMRIYMWEAAGAAAAGLLFAFVLAGRVNPFSLFLVSGGLLLCASGWFTGRWRALLIPAGLLLVGLALTPLPAAWNRASLARSVATLPGAGTMKTCADTSQGRLCLSAQEGMTRLYRDGVYDYSWPDPWSRAPAVLLSLAAHPSPRKVMLIGGGVPDRLEAALEAGADEVIAVYMDDREHALLTGSGWRQPHPSRLRVVNDDPRAVLRRRAIRPDAILLSVPLPTSSAANRLFTVEFYREAAAALTGEGIFVVQVPGSANVLDEEGVRLLSDIRATLRAAFPQVDVLPGTDTLFIATKRGSPNLSAGLLTARLRRRGDDDLAARAQMDDRFSPLRMAAVNAQLDTATGTVQTDREPRAFLSGLARRAGMTNHHPGEGAVDLRPFLHAPAVITIAALLAFFVHSLVARSGTFRILRRRSALVSLFTTGFAGIAAQVVIVHVFAATFGGLYRHIAWIFGLYMAGLAAGALAGSRWTGPKAAIAADWFVLVLLIAMGTVWAPHPGPAAITGAVTLLAGAATGFPFPVLFRAWRASSDLLPSTAAATAADYLGAAAGALAVSLTLLPVLGPAWTCVLVAAFKLPTLRLAIQSPPD